MFYFLLFFELNPSSTLPFAGKDSLVNMIKLIIKIWIAFWYCFDYGASFAIEFLDVLTMGNLLLTSSRIYSSPNYDDGISRLYVYCEAAATWTGVSSLLTNYVDDAPVDELGFVFSVVGIPIISYFALYLYDTSKFHFMDNRLGTMNEV